MSKRKTVGERAAIAIFGHPEPEAVAIIDRAICRAQAKAWDECYVRICESDLCIAADLKVPRNSNPYRGRAKR